MLGLAGGAMAQLAVQWLFSAQLVLDLAAVAGSLVASLEVLIGLVKLVRSLGLPVVKAGLLLLLLLFGRHGGVCAGGCCSSFVGAIWCYWCGKGAGRIAGVLGGSVEAVAEDSAAGRLAESSDSARGVGC